MIPLRVFLLTFCISFMSFAGQESVGQKFNPELISRDWDAHWVTHPDFAEDKAGVYLFRKKFDLESVPDDFLIHVSADNRYKLFVNGKFVSYGPSRGDLLNWRFESINISSHLKPGANTLCVLVWNYADLRPVAQVSFATGLIVQGNTQREKVVNTGQGWRVMRDDAYTQFPIKNLNAYYVVGPGESFDGEKHPWNWTATDLDDQAWKTVKSQDKGQMQNAIKGTGRLPKRMLVPRSIPAMEMTKQEFSAVRRTKGIDDAKALLEDDQDLIVAPNSHVTILLDQGRLTTAYPNIHFSGGAGSELKLTYAESLYRQSDHPHDKGDRDRVEGKVIKGNYDVFVADGGADRRVEPLWWRTFRYVEVEVVTQAEALTLHRINSVFTGYPLKEKASFKSDRPILSEIWNVGWNTQRMCAGEVFYDCPYYEQLQYAGDTRIQGLTTYYVSGDSALWKKSIESFYHSRLPLGLTQSRYPCRQPQIIPTFSLVWVTMCHDYLYHCDDPKFIKSMMPAVDDVLQWFEDRLDQDGLVGDFPYWAFVDWVGKAPWKIGVPPRDDLGRSSIITLQYVYTLQKASELYAHFGQTDRAEHCKNLAGQIKQSVLDHCWDETRKMVADTPAKQTFSQHAGVLAVLVGLLPADENQALMQRVIDDESLLPCSYYFRFYLAEALKESGLADRYVDLLTPWEGMLDRGLTTFAEKADPTRSDCHAWSASPLYHFLSLVAGIEPGSPGFQTVRIKPALGPLKKIDVRMPHPNGDIELQLKRTEDGRVEGNVVLPPGLEGVLDLGQTTVPLKPGKTPISLSANASQHRKTD